ncbi:hypothetical protein [Actinoplanes sp. NPDC049802]|uniref:hypothetical protein n=1 Tax=Actinoplanes sp. NPDC049802 TaxID=3154742 RepID=UPI00340244F3
MRRSPGGVVAAAPGPNLAPAALTEPRTWQNNGRDPGNGTVPRCTGERDAGQRTAPPFTVGGRTPGRERLAADPRNHRNVYFAAEGGNGPRWGGAAVTAVTAGYHGPLASGASTLFGLPGGTTGTTDPVPSPITCSTTP